MHILLYNFQHNTFYVVWETLLSIAVETNFWNTLSVSRNANLRCFELLDCLLQIVSIPDANIYKLTSGWSSTDLWDTYKCTKKNKEFGLSPHCGAPWDPDWTKTAHAQLDHGANNMTPLLGLYDILFQRRCGNILFTDRQMAGRQTDGYRISTQLVFDQ